MKELNVFFDPKTVAIIGASDQFRFGYATTNYLLNSKFKTYPVHIKKDKILGHKAYKNIKDIPDEIDLAIILIGNDYVLESVKDCAEKGVKGIIIESAGFSETGIEKYIEIQNEIAKIAKDSHIRIIGPNCIGVTNFYNEFTTADMAFDQAIKGNVSIIAQSGVLGNIFIDWATDQGIGLSKAITIGNKVDVDEVDMVEYLIEDPETKVITIYLEGTKRGKTLLKTLKKSEKPILILKNGRSQIGSNAVKSHTGSLAGNDQFYTAFFKQIPTVFRVNNFYEMFNIAQVFATQPLPNGRNVAIITGSGSLGALACDEIEKQGLILANLKKETINQIKDVIPNWVSINATIDLGPSLFQTLIPSLEAVYRDENVNSILFIFTVPRWPLEMFNISPEPFFDQMKNLSKEYDKPIICVCFGSRWTFEYLKKSALSQQSDIKIPIMTRIKHAIKAFKMMYEFNQNLTCLQV